MSKKIVTALLLIAALALITGCSGSGGSQGGDLTKTYIGGTVGLNPYLVEGMPPPTVTDGGTYSFGVGVALENQGESDVGPGTDNPFLLVRLVGINPEEFGVTDDFVRQQPNVPILGSKRNFDGTAFPGEMTNVNFEPLMYGPSIHGNNPITMRVDLCYDYTNIATTQICMKDEVLENIQDASICTMTGQKNPQNSGGPIHVTSVIENPMSSSKIQVNFVLEHVGIGEFFGRPGTGTTTDEQCDFSIRNTNKYYVDVEVEPMADAGVAITCARFQGGNAGRVKLYQGSPTTISCTLERTRASAGRIYQGLLNIKLKYRYGQYIETPLIIQHVSV